MIVRQPRKIVQYDASFGIPMETIETDYSDHPLVIGPRYEYPDVRMYCPLYLGLFSSGVYGMMVYSTYYKYCAKFFCS